MGERWGQGQHQSRTAALSLAGEIDKWLMGDVLVTAQVQYDTIHQSRLMLSGEEILQIEMLLSQTELWIVMLA